MNWKSTPENIGSPILVSSNRPVPIDKVRQNIENTKIFAEEILRVLGGKE